MVDVPRKKKYKAAILNDKEINQLLKAFKDTDIYIPVLSALTTGLRRGKALGLRWEDIDFKNKTITINQTILRSKVGYTIGTTKIEKSNRTIVISDSILKILEKHKKQQDEYKKCWIKLINTTT